MNIKKKQIGGTRDTATAAAAPRSRMKTLKKSQREARKELRQGEKEERKENRAERRVVKKALKFNKKIRKKVAPLLKGKTITKKTAKALVKKYGKDIRKEGPAKAVTQYERGGFLEPPVYDLDRD